MSPVSEEESFLPPLEDQILVCVEDRTNRRLIEGVAIQLGLRPQVVCTDEMVKTASIDGIAMIVADESIAKGYRGLFALATVAGEQIPAALVAVLPSTAVETSPLTRRTAELPYDGVLVLPQTPAIVLAQLSLILYAHRAYLRRFETTMEELQLNRRIFRSVTSGISVATALEPDFPLVYVNPAFEVMTGYSLEEIEGKNCRFLQREERDRPGLTIIREALAGRHEATSIIRNYRKDGSAFWNELALSPITDAAGNVTHIVGIQNDVSARVAFERALRESEKLAATGRLAASIAHEINNPLATVTNLLFLARAEDDDRQKDSLLEMAEEELGRVTVLTTQSLRFYKQSSKPTAVRPVDLVSAVLSVYSVKMAQVAITLHRKDLTTESIVCLESEIRQVFSNLIRNAMDSLEGKPGKVFVRVRSATNWEDGSKGVSITVADTGSGMSQETKATLYTAFHTTKEHTGTGLGLWVSKEILDRHHGWIRVRSRKSPISGTVFVIFLPHQSFV